MPRPSDTALKGRARALLEAMTEHLRWIYAVPRDDGPTAAKDAATAAGLSPDGEARWASAKAAITLVDRPDLDVLVVEATGEEAPPVLSQILEQAGFYAQSTLLGTAHDLRDEEAPEALATLATMVVVWDAAWRDLFVLHLRAEDPALRREAARSLAIAATVAHAPKPAAALLEEAVGREKDDAVKETLAAALSAVGAMSA
jgi:hypothetical protein